MVELLELSEAVQAQESMQRLQVWGDLSPLLTRMAEQLVGVSSCCRNSRNTGLRDDLRNVRQRKASSYVTYVVRGVEPRNAF